MTSKARVLTLHAGIVCLILFSLSAIPAQAQTNFMVYRVKFTCGFAPGNIPDSGSFANVLPVPYREVQPGSYSTVINILNARFNARDSRVSSSILVEGFPTVAGPGFTMQTFSTTSHARIDCAAIASALATRGFQADGRFVEGFVMVMARDALQNEGSDLEVAAVYTYGSRKSENNGTGLGSSLQVERIQGRLEVEPE